MLHAVHDEPCARGAPEGSPEPAAPQARNQRTCAGCRTCAAREELLRLAHVPDGASELVPDLGGKLGGRGVWVHPTRACVEAAARRGGFARSLRKPLRADADALCAALSGQIEVRAEGLLSAALRKRVVAVGTDAAREALSTGAARVLVVANDAAGRRDELCGLAERRDCPVTELLDKARLGRLAGRETLGIMAISDAGIAKEIGSCARRLTGLRRVNE